MKIKLIIIDSFESEKESGFEYFYTGDHLDRFLYSPENSDKKIETFFE